MGAAQGLKGSCWSTGKQKDPLWLQALVQLHNVILITLSAYMCGSAVYYAWLYDYNFWGTAYSPREVGMGRTVYIFYVSKLYEFMDTVLLRPCLTAFILLPPDDRVAVLIKVCAFAKQAIMLLKGNLKQVSLLHVYHHMSISCIW